MEPADEDAISKTGLWFAYKAAIRRCIMNGQVYDSQDISYWRDRLFTIIVTYFLPASFIALVPGVIISFLSGHWLIGIADLMAYVVIASITLIKGLSITVRKVTFITTVYCLSVALLLSLSLFGPGMIYLLSVCIPTTLILPKFWGYVSAFANIFTCICCAMIIHLKVFESPLLSYGLGAWIAVCSNLVFLSFIVVAIISHAIEGLENTLISDALLRAKNLAVIRNLEHSEQRLKQAQALAHYGSWELDFSNGLGIWSDETCRIYGLPVEKNVQSYTRWLDFIHPEDRDNVLRTAKEAEQTLSNTCFYHRIIKNDGQIRYLYSESKYELDQEGYPTGMYGISHDITELKENQEELRRSNERFELVNRAAREAIMDWDIVRDTTVWGHGFTEIFGYQPAEYHNHLLSDNVHPEDRCEALRILQETLDDPSQTILQREFRFLKADRSVAHVQIRTVLIRDKLGRAIRAVSSLTDVTDLVSKTNVLEKQNMALRDIAWIQSHELRSPLACIMGLVEMLKHKGEHALDDEQLINEIQKATAKLDGVIHEVVQRTAAME